MATALQIPPEQRTKPGFLIEIHLLMEHPSRWKEFPDNLRAAFGKSIGVPGLEQELGRAPRTALAGSVALHVTTALALLFLFPRIEISFPVVLDESPRQQTVIYYPAPLLPQVEDANAGKATASAPKRAVAKPQPANDEAFHPVQTIRISRGNVIRQAVVDAPNLKLPRLAGATANILELPAVPAPAPQLAPQPVELAHVRSTLAQAKREEPVTAAVTQLRGEAALPDLSIRTAMPSAAPQPVELARVKSKFTGAAAGPERVPRVPQLQSAQTVLPELALGRAPAVVVSVNNGDAVALPANGGPGSLAISPQGRKQPNPGAGGMTASTSPGGLAVPGNGVETSDGTGHESAKLAGGAAPESGRNGGASKPGTPVIPGVVVRGGVVMLDSFGPKAPPKDSRAGDRAAAERARKPAAITIVATSRSGGGLDAYGFFKSQRVYTIYIDTKAGPVVLQFAARDAASDAAEELSAPDPIAAELEAEQSRASFVISCVLVPEGSLKDLRVVRGVEGTEAAKALLETLATWRFHPALSRGKPVAVDALIGIRTGVH